MILCLFSLVPALHLSASNYEEKGGLDQKKQIKPWDVSLKFLYWQPSQDNMEMGLVGDTEGPVDLVKGDEQNLSFPFKPGLKVALGAQCQENDWRIDAEYTWLESSTTKETRLNPTNSFVGFYPAWEFSTTNPAYFFGKEKWDISCNFLDLTVYKKAFLSKSLSFSRFLGIRAPWIRQKVKLDYISRTTSPDIDSKVRQRFHSWGIGLRGGMGAEWEMGSGFLMFSKLAADLVYTQYRDLFFRQELLGSDGQTVNFSRLTIKQDAVGYIRPHVDMTLGLGWGKVWKNWSLDLLSDYSFQVFFDQNMFRNFLDDQAYGKSIAPNGNLYMQGLTLTAKVGF